MDDHEAEPTDAPGGMGAIDDEPVRTPNDEDGPGGMSGIPPADSDG